MNGQNQIMQDRIDFSRVVIIGNSGSGKSHFANKLSRQLDIPATDLDQIHWLPGGYHKKREAVAAREMIRQVATAENWIIEGVYGWLVQEILPRATTLFWLDLPLEQCIDNIIGRGHQNEQDEIALANLIAWAREYPTRTSSSSQSGHNQLFTSFAGSKFRFATQDAVSGIFGT